jgi:hypothetical protein
MDCSYVRADISVETNFHFGSPGHLAISLVTESDVLQGRPQKNPHQHNDQAEYNHIA